MDLYCTPVFGFFFFPPSDNSDIDTLYTGIKGQHHHHNILQCGRIYNFNSSGDSLNDKHLVFICGCVWVEYFPVEKIQLPSIAYVSGSGIRFPPTQGYRET